MATAITIPPTVSPFFKLACELRDQIYDECLIDHSQRGACAPSYHASNIAATNLLLVSRQFSSEYNQRASALSHCRIVDHTTLILESFAYRLAYDIVMVPSAFAKIGSFRFNLACYDGLEELTGHSIWLSKYLEKMTSVRSVVIGISFSMREFNEPRLLINAINKERLIGVRNLKELQVYLVAKGMDLTLIANNGSHNHKLVAKLSKETGKVEAVED